MLLGERSIAGSVGATPKTSVMALLFNPAPVAWLVFPLGAPAGLPPAPSGPDDCVEIAAREAVATLVRAMNAVVVPVIQTLERS